MGITQSYLRKKTNLVKINNSLGERGFPEYFKADQD